MIAGQQPGAVSSGLRADLLHEIEGLIANLRRYARSLASTVDEADDVVQETLILALSKLHLFRPGSNLRAWLFTIARNVFINRFRQKRAEVALNDKERGLTTAPAQESYVVLGEVARAYQCLSPQHREVLALVVFEGMRYGEAGALMGMPVGTVQSRLSRARSALRQALGYAPKAKAVEA